MQTDTAIELDRLTVSFPAQDGGWVDAVDGVTLTVGEGERVGLVGESGSGKSLTALACLGLVPEPGRLGGGSVKVFGTTIDGMSNARLQRLRGSEVGLVFQEAIDALNPVYRVGFQLAETIRVHRGLGLKDASREALALLGDAALDHPTEIARAYPHELSGGEAQRVMVALALAGGPRMLIADEPTSALDSLTQAQVIDLIGGLARQRNMGLLLISHDLAVVEGTVDRVAVFFSGRILETGPTLEIFSQPLHPYTQELLTSAPGRRRKPTSLPLRKRHNDRSVGDGGCRYAGRCEMARPSCLEAEPELTEMGGDRSLRCPVVLNQHQGTGFDD
jgi:oligopeptide/dipeptide ABC transporter ATP-binding protein